MADALAHAHARLIVHRDIKPANIILTPDRGPVLVDFGLGLDEASAGGSELGVVSGTPAYMAPEQVAGAAHRIDGRTDIYSLGVVLYEMLCGHVPFRATNLRELLRQVRDDEPQPPRQLNRDIPPELESGLPEGAGEAAPGPLHHRRRFRRGPAAREPVGRHRPPRLHPGNPRSEHRRADHTGHPRPRSSKMPTPRHHPGAAPARLSAGRSPSSCCGCDLFESDAYLGNLDAEDQSEVLRAFQGACEQGVGRFDGAVVQCNEQGLLACFGYPVAHEDAARRACGPASAILEEMEALGARLRREHRAGAEAVGRHPHRDCHRRERGRTRSR